MRIGLVIYGSLETVSGGFLYDRQLVDYLRGCGDEVRIFALPWRSYGRCLLHNLSPSFTRQLRQADLDVLLQDELNHPSLFWLNRRLRRQASYPLVSIVHHLRSSERWPAWRRPFYRRVERAYLHTLDGCIYNSATTRAAVEALSDRRLPHVVAYPAGDRFANRPDAAAVAARARQPGPLRIVFVGNLIARKGLGVLLAALARLPLADWRLTVVGNTAVDPAYTRRIHNQVARAGLAANLTWGGVLLDDALAQLLADSHVLVVPSTYEGFGIVYLEGMGFGLPAIASTAGAAHEIITDGQDGYLVPPNDPEALAARLRRLHADRALLAQLGQNALQRYAAHPTWADSMARIRGFLQTFTPGATGEK